MLLIEKIETLEISLSMPMAINYRGLLKTVSSGAQISNVTEVN